VSRRLPVAAATIAVLVTLSACSPSKDSGKSEAGAPSTLKGSTLTDKSTCTTDKVGGAVNFGAYVDGPGLDPAAPQANQGGMQQAAIYGTLMHYNYDTAEYEPSVADSLESNATKTEWTLKLRPNVTFGDGTPLTADAVKTSIARFTARENPSNFTAQVALVKTMDVVDESTLIFKLSKPWGSFPYILSAQPGMIVNPKVLAHGGAKQLALKPTPAAGVGPYTVERYTSGQELVLKAKQNWWGGPVCIQDLTFTVTVDGKTKLDTFKSGQEQAFITFDAPVAKQVMASADRFFVIPNPVISNVQVLANAGAPLSDPKLRIALQQAMDLDSINKRIYAGVGVPSAALVDPASPVAPDVKALGYDPKAAKDILAGAGGSPSFEYSLNAAPLQTDLSILQEAFWKNAGFTVKRKELQNSDLITKVYIDRTYDAAQWGMGADPACLWCSLASWRSDDPSNISNFKSTEMDSALDGLREAQTPDEIKAAMGIVQSVWNTEMPSPISGYLKWVVPVSPKLHGLVFNSGTTIQFDKAYLDQ
jgi:peptide/nickel transport system substrate-binding protein